MRVVYLMLNNNKIWQLGCLKRNCYYCPLNCSRFPGMVRTVVKTQEQEDFIKEQLEANKILEVIEVEKI